MNRRSMPFAALRVAFASYNRTTNKSPQTVVWYDKRLGLFERYLGLNANLDDVTVENVRSFVAELQGRTTRHENNQFVLDKEGGLSSSYIQGFVRALRAFSSWLYEDGYTDANVLKVVRPPKIQHKVVAVLTDEDIRRLLATFDRSSPYGERDYAIVLTLLDCGLRASELCNLKLSDAHLEQGFVKVLGKGDKERLVPIGRTTADALLHWRDRVRAEFETGDAQFLFLGASGGQITVNAIEQMIRRAGIRAGIPHLHPHRLRHTFATNYLVKEVGDPLRLQQVLGHTSLEMVRRYVSIASVQQSLVERRASPMDLIAAGPARPRHQRVQPTRATSRQPPRNRSTGVREP